MPGDIWSIFSTPPNLVYLKYGYPGNRICIHELVRHASRSSRPIARYTKWPADGRLHCERRPMLGRVAI